MSFVSVYVLCFVCLYYAFINDNTHTLQLCMHPQRTYTSMTGTKLLPGSPLVPCNTVIGTNNFFFCGYPKPPWSVQGIWSEYNTVTGSVSHTELLTLLLGNWFWCNYCHRTWSWCNTVAKTNLFIHRADTKLCRSTLALCGSANLTGSHTNRAKSG